MDSLPEKLEPGTIVEFDGFAALVVGDDLMLVFESEMNIIQEGAVIRFNARGSNDWVLSLTHDDGWSHMDFWIGRDWNGHVKTRYYDEYDDWHHWLAEEWDDKLDSWLDAYETFDPDDY